MSRAAKAVYVWFVSRLVLVLARWCLRRGRYVDYVHQGRFYLRRYAVCGWLTGDMRPIDAERWHSAGMLPSWRVWWARVRARLPNLYLHQMINPDLDTCLHDHPWPWAVSWIMLGGYTEHRAPASLFTKGMITEHERKAPALNVLRGTDFHRIADIEKIDCRYMTRKGRMGVCRQPDCCGNQWKNTWTLFLAGPRRRAKPWGYLVPGRGYVHHRERHAEFGGEEKRGAPVRV